MTYSLIIDCRRGIKDADLEQISLLLKRGGSSIVFPTDTVYGIGATVHDHEATKALRRMKGRAPDKPLPVLVPGLDSLEVFSGVLSDTARNLVSTLWPGALTLIVQASSDLNWDLGQTDDTVALRMPANPITLSLLERTGPLATTSANISGLPPAVCVEEAVKSFGSHVAAYLDGGKTPGNIPSSIVDVTVDPPRLLRPGAIALEILSECAGVQIEDVEATGASSRGGNTLP